MNSSILSISADLKKLSPIRQGNSPKLYIETYGCQMNVSDSEVVASIMKAEGYVMTDELNEADVVLINTCSIRENAETRVWGRLDLFRTQKKKRPDLIIGVIGCMAERLKETLLEEEKSVDIVVGPDAYRDLPQLVSTADSGQKAVNVILSREETYADISPVRLDKNKISAFVSIMRGCNNFCTYCVVPYTRGRERSRDAYTIVREVKEIIDMGYKEVTLLGQNVDSYRWKANNGEEIDFSELLEMVALVDPKLRVRFSTSHPKDMSDRVLHTMAKHNNICKSIHLPFQSGSSAVLANMKRGYTREEYIDRIEAVRRILPECAISTDIIAGFCSETDADHQQTLSLMRWLNLEYAFMFKYSERPGTFASKNLKDDVSEEVKSARLTEIIDLQTELSLESKKIDKGRIFEVLAEGTSKKNKDELYGRTTQNKVVVFPKMNYKPGDYVNVEITSYTSGTLIGKIS